MNKVSKIFRKIYNARRDRMITTRMLHTNLIVFRLVYFLFFVALPMLFFKGDYIALITIIFVSAIINLALTLTLIHLEGEGKFDIHDFLLNISTRIGYICMKVIQYILLSLSITLFIYSFIPS